MNVPMLNVENLHAGYEPGNAIEGGVSTQVMRGEIMAVLGANGAGKSTLIKAIAGLVAKFTGKVTLDGIDITEARTHEMARGGLGFVPQTENVFTLMSIADNLRIAADILPKPERARQIEEMYGLFPDLAERRRLAAIRLSGGQRQMLALARALIPQPRLLMLDEPSAGLSPKIVGQVFTKLAEIRSRGVTILMVEQNAKAALTIADRALILADGKIAHQALAAEVARDPSIARLVLGGKPQEGAA